jgi:hypothetical protein
MNKKFIKIFTFCLFREQPESCKKCQLNEHSSVKSMCSVIKKLLTLQYLLTPQTCIQFMKVALQKLRGTEYFCSKTNSYQ